MFLKFGSLGSDSQRVPGSTREKRIVERWARLTLLQRITLFFLLFSFGIVLYCRNSLVLLNIVADHLFDLFVAVAPLLSHYLGDPGYGYLLEGIQSKDVANLHDRTQGLGVRLKGNFDYILLLSSLFLGWLNFSFNLIREPRLGYSDDNTDPQPVIEFIVIALIWLLSLAPIVILLRKGTDYFANLRLGQTVWVALPPAIVILQIYVFGYLENWHPLPEPPVKKSEASLDERAPRMPAPVPAASADAPKNESTPTSSRRSTLMPAGPVSSPTVTIP